MRRKTNWKDEPCYLYYFENKINGNIYIGISKHPEQRRDSHKRVSKGGPDKHRGVYSYIHRGINKYGWENFEFNIVEYFPTRLEAKEAEIFWIAELKRVNIKVYNLTKGGDGVSGYEYTEEERKAMSERMKGKCIGEANPFFGKMHTEETKVILSASMTKRQANGDFRGENHSHSIFTNEIVLAIRQDYINTDASQQDLAYKYNTSRANVANLVTGEVWNHIDTISYDTKENQQIKTEAFWKRKKGSKIIHNLTCEWCQINFDKIYREKSIKSLPKYCGVSCKMKAIQANNAINKLSNKPLRKLDITQKEQLVKDANQMTIIELAEKYEIHKNSVRKILKRYNITPYKCLDKNQ